MPNIPVFTADSGSPRQRSPSYIPTGNIEQAQLDLARSIEKAGRVTSQFADVSNRIKQQNEDSEVIDLGARYDAGVTAIHQALANDSEVKEDPGLYVKKFNDGSTKLASELYNSSSSERVKTLFGNHIGRVLPKQQVEAEGIGLTLAAIQGKANHIRALDTMAGVAASASDNTSEAITNIAIDSINAAWKRNFYKDEVARDKAIKDFKENVSEKRMIIVGDYSLSNDGDLYTLRTMFKDGKFNNLEETKRLKIMESFDNREREAKSRAKTAFNDGTKMMHDNYAAQAINKAIPQSELDEMKNGGMTQYGITPEMGLHFEKMQNAAETTEGSDAIIAVMSRYATSMQTQKDNEITRQALKQIEDDLAKAGKINKLIVQYGDKLGADRVRNRSLENQETAANIRRGTEALTIDRPTPSFIPMIRQRQSDDAHKENARLRMLIEGDPTRGIPKVSWEEALRIVRTERQQRDESLRKRNPTANPATPGVSRDIDDQRIDEVLRRK